MTFWAGRGRPGRAYRYDPSTRPTFGGGADKVYVQFKLNSLYDIDPLSSTFTVDCDLRLSWIDDRLIFDPEQYPIPNTTDLRALGHASLGNGYGAPHLVWTPDVYFENEVEPTIHNEVIKLIPGTGEVSYRRHFLSRLTTNFTFQSFPFDAQVRTCSFPHLEVVFFANAMSSLRALTVASAFGDPLLVQRQTNRALLPTLPRLPRTYLANLWTLIMGLSNLQSSTGAVPIAKRPAVLRPRCA